VDGISDGGSVFFRRLRGKSKARGKAGPGSGSSPNSNKTATYSLVQGTGEGNSVD